METPEPSEADSERDAHGPGRKSANGTLNMAREVDLEKALEDMKTGIDEAIEDMKAGIAEAVGEVRVLSIRILIVSVANLIGVFLIAASTFLIWHKLFATSG